MRCPPSCPRRARPCSNPNPNPKPNPNPNLNRNRNRNRNRNPNQAGSALLVFHSDGGTEHPGGFLLRWLELGLGLGLRLG